MKTSTIQLIQAVIAADDSVSPEHAAQIRQIAETGGGSLPPVVGPLLTISAAARSLGHCRPWLYAILAAEANLDPKNKTFQTVPEPGGGFRIPQSDVEAYKSRRANFKPRPSKRWPRPGTKISNVIGN